MRLSFALAGLAGGLALGWGAAALADAGAPPPAAPIFYCPTPPAQTAAQTPAKTPVSHAGGGHHRRVVVTRVRHVSGGQGCPTAERTHGDRHHWGHDGRQVAVITDGRGGPGDVSASQAFIYRYERLHRGLDARAADQAWADDGRHDGHRPPMPLGPPMRMGPPPMAEAPPPRPPMPPIPPTPPHGDRWAHDGDGAQHDAWADDGRRDGHDGQHDWRTDGHGDGHDADRDHHDGHGDHDGAALAWQDREQSGGGVRYQRSVTEHSGGWSYSDQDGHAQFHQWGDGGSAGAHNGAAIGEAWHGDAHGGDQWRGDSRHHGAQACPPGPSTPCAAAARYHGGSGQWRDGSYGPVYSVAGRDAEGYLVWPGKTPQ